jgi:hypothetical protein
MTAEETASPGRIKKPHSRKSNQARAPLQRLGSGLSFERSRRIYYTMTCLIRGIKREPSASLLLLACAPHNGRDDMVLCDNVFCSSEVIEFEYIALAGRKFCCVACSDAWRQQNEALAEAARPLRDTSRSQEERRGRNWTAARRTALT